MALTAIAHFSTHLFMLIYPTIAVIQARRWGIPVADLLVWTVPGFMLYGLLAVPWGTFADRHQGSLPVALGLLGMAVGALGCAAAQSPWQIGLGLGVVGAFAAAYHPAGLRLITHGVQRSSRALGVNGAFGSGAVALAPALAQLLAERLGWRAAFLALAIPAGVVGLAFLLKPLRLVASTPPATGPPQAARPAPSGRLFSVPFLVLCLAMLLNGLAYRGASVVLPTLFDERVGFVGHGVATSLTYTLAILMNVVGGRLAERFSGARIYLVFHLLSFPGIALTAWLSGLPLMLLAALYTGCALGAQPAENTLVATLTPPDRRGLAYGVKFTLAFGLGALAVPVVSHLLKTQGSQAVMMTLAGFVAALGLVLLGGFRTLNRRLPQ